jgi:hypothetical protein
MKTPHMLENVSRTRQIVIYNSNSARCSGSNDQLASSLELIYISIQQTTRRIAGLGTWEGRKASCFPGL